ncbi:MAG: hypothetical protein BWY72_01937 [Bacteroidetes bacterium ADurb.Bin416]|nr:MAG: hypothetical protein BWY72_01937 [Bacteroidetes bacterium ADurb.Bin416]
MGAQCVAFTRSRGTEVSGLVQVETVGYIGLLGRKGVVGVSNEATVGFDQRQKLSTTGQFEVGMQGGSGYPSVLAGGVHQQVVTGVKGEGGEHPLVGFILFVGK